MNTQHLLSYIDSDDEEMCSLPRESVQVNNIVIEQIKGHLKSVESGNAKRTWCKICNMELTSSMHAQTHYFSANHLKNFQRLKERQLLVPKVHCQICNLYVDGDMMTNGHLSTKEHQKNAEKYCIVCKVRTISKDALKEHETFSSSHQKAMERLNYVSNSNNSNVSQPSLCEPLASRSSEVKELKIPQVCVTPKKPAAKLPVTGESKIYCATCDIQYMPEKFSSYSSQFPHSAMEMLKTRYSLETTRAFCSIIDGKYLLCNVCDINMKCLGDINSHLNSLKHIKKFRTKFPEHALEEVATKGTIISTKDTPIKEVAKQIIERVSESKVKDDRNKIVKDVVLNDKEKTLETIGQDTGTDVFSCYLCKLNFKNKIQLNVHAIRFPHVEMAKWKAGVVSLGIPYAEYWTFSETSLTCTLCNVSTFNPVESRKHVNEVKHKTLLAEWCKEFASWQLGKVTDPKYFYCKSCDLRLSGTSEAKSHYNSDTHLIRLKLYCDACQLSNSSDEMLLEHSKSREHQVKSFKDSSVKNRVDENIEGNDSSLKEQPEQVEHANDSLEAQVCRQLEKLIDNVYYSKVVPFDVALEYLKKINSEVDELKEKYGPKASKPQPLKTVGNSPTRGGLSQHVGKSGPLKVVVNCSKSPDLDETFMEEDVLSVTRENSKLIKQDHIIISNTFTKEKDDDPRLDEKSHFSDVYRDIMNLRQQITEPCPERDVLDEVKSLIRAIDACAAPLGDILRLLQTFIGNLDLEISDLKINDVTSGIK